MQYNNGFNKKVKTGEIKNGNGKPVFSNEGNENLFDATKKEKKKKKTDGRQYSFYMDRDVYHNFKVLSLALNKTQAEIVNIALSKYIDTFNMSDIERKAQENIK